MRRVKGDVSKIAQGLQSGVQLPVAETHITDNQEAG